MLFSRTFSLLISSHVLFQLIRIGEPWMFGQLRSRDPVFLEGQGLLDDILGLI